MCYSFIAFALYVWWKGLVVFCAYYSMSSWLSIQSTTPSGTLGWLLPICLLFILAPSQITVLHVCSKLISYHTVFFLLLTIFCKLRIIFFFLNVLSVCIQVFLIHPWGISGHIYLKAFNFLCYYSERFALDSLHTGTKLLLLHSIMSIKMYYFKSCRSKIYNKLLVLFCSWGGWKKAWDVITLSSSVWNAWEQISDYIS